MTTRARAEEAAAWSQFWAKNTGGDQGGCLPKRWAAIEEAQRAAWDGFVTDLPQGAAVLDLATGDGRVLRWVHKLREDLELVGVDLAPDLPAAPEGTRVTGGVAMEDVPEPGDRFDAIVSQFGFEYGDVPKVAGEIARMLKPYGKVGLMVHRGDGPILEHNKTRREAIAWAISEKSACEVARTALSAPNGGPEAAGQVGAALALLGSRKFGQDSPAWEIPEALRRAALMAQRTGVGNALETIAAIEAQAQNELGRIASLERACATADARKPLLDAFEARGLSLASTAPIAEPSGRALADFLILS